MPTNRGIFAKKTNDFPIALRITTNDRNLIEQEAMLLGLTVGAFMRWCAIHTAREIQFIRSGRKVRVDL